MDALMHPMLERCLHRLGAHTTTPDIRRNAERQLSMLLLQLVVALLEPALMLEGTGAILLDHFRYRLAHVAMRSRDWMLAEQLLEAVLQGHGDLRLARIYQALCSSKRSQAPLDASDLSSLVSDLVAPV